MINLVKRNKINQITIKESKVQIGWKYLNKKTNFITKLIPIKKNNRINKL
jgi:hypothetical protein